VRREVASPRRAFGAFTPRPRQELGQRLHTLRSPFEADVAEQGLELRGERVALLCFVSPHGWPRTIAPTRVAGVWLLAAVVLGNDGCALLPLDSAGIGLRHAGIPPPA
jgi:hypothetical protein